MSIFPKKVVKDENVIIHLKFVNEEEISFFHYVTRIISPSGKEITSWENSFMIPPGEKGNPSKKELYYCVDSSLLIEPGKYLAKTNLYFQGKIIKSITAKNDCFYVERVSILNYKENENKVTFDIINDSDIETKINIIDRKGDILQEMVLNGNEKRTVISDASAFIRYENGTVQKIVSMKKRFIRNVNGKPCVP